ncbi:MAG: ABC transporter ATP-binding protein [Negativicutes bacterium]
MDDSTILTINHLKTYFYTRSGVAKAVDDVSFSLQRGEILGIVGESGSGKSIMSKSILQLIKPPGKIVGGEILFRNRGNLLSASSKEIRAIRGNEISMIFQEPMTSLNPVLTIGEQIAESLICHKGMSPAAAYAKAEELLTLVHINQAAGILRSYPHQLSGGMRQRVMIAIALSCSPDLLIADEPTTALDVTIQAQMLQLLRELRDKLNMSVIIITHDMGVISEMADRVAVMYCGKIMEYGDVRSVLETPHHPYTAALLAAIPKLNGEQEALNVIPGMVPSLYSLPTGCRFSSRCHLAMEICREKEPKLQQTGGSQVNCWRCAEEDKLL